MHPIESSLYYSASFIPVVFGLHPLIAIGCIMDLATGAWFGHDGFQVINNYIFIYAEVESLASVQGDNTGTTVLYLLSYTLS
jgi:hypothetical protein